MIVKEYLFLGDAPYFLRRIKIFFPTNFDSIYVLPPIKYKYSPKSNGRRE